MTTPIPNRCCAPGCAMRGCWRTPSRSPAARYAQAEFAISVATMEGRIDTDEAGLRRTALADAAMAALLEPVMAEFSGRFGRVSGGVVAVVALGKAGGREMMAGSDLDLMLIYDHPDSVDREPRQARACRRANGSCGCAHAYVAALTAPGVDGPLYAGGHAAAPIGQQRTGRRLAVRVPALPRGSRLDLGAHGADARPRDRRARAAAQAYRGRDPCGPGGCRRA